MEKTIYTKKDWSRDTYFNASKGQEIEESIYFNMLDCLSPRILKNNYFLMGEAYDHNGDNFKVRYMLFYKNNNKYYYGGLVEADTKKIENILNTL